MIYSSAAYQFICAIFCYSVILNLVIQYGKHKEQWTFAYVSVPEHSHKKKTFSVLMTTIKLLLFWWVLLLFLECF